VVSSTTAAQSNPGSAEPSVSPAPTQGQAGTTILAAGSDVGAILFDATGQAIYIFDVETTSNPRCYDACAEAWPPVLTQSAPQAGQGIRGSLLGTTPRAGGTLQVTYGGHPLYFYAHEGKHEVKCHNVFLNGGKWYALTPDGFRAP
jgi:predicted lipoprotein with Yx(FWY)xxD motif